MQHSSRTTDGDAVSVSVEHLGGIERCDVTFQPGVTVFSGRNATNRTSFLSALAGALGGSAATLKRDRDAGRVSLAVGGEIYDRSYERTADGVAVGGTPYTSRSTLVDTFACLLEDNPVRRAVEGGGDLRGVIMQPVDTDAIDARIAALRERAAELDEQLAGIREKRRRLPALREKHAALEAELEEVEAALADAREAASEATAGEGDDAVDDLVAARERRREDLERARDRVAAKRESVSALVDRREELEETLASAAVDEDDLDGAEAAVERLERRERSLAGTIDDLTAIATFNADLLDGDRAIPEPLRGGEAAGGAEADGGQDAGAGLDASGGTVACWTCGSTVERDALTDRLGALREVAAEKREEREVVREELDAARDRLNELRAAADERDEAESSLSVVERELDRRREEIERLEADVEDAREALADADDALVDADAVGGDLAERYRRLSDLQFERGQREQALSQVTSTIERLDALGDRQDRLRDDRAALANEVETLRTRVDDLERDAVSEFNDRMTDVLDLLRYENVERVWLERRVHPDRENEFVLHVARDGDTVYEDDVENLSESEREVVGLVVALAGYLAHEVHETVPVMILDSLEAIDAERIRALVDYFSDYAPYVAVALLPEDAQALDDYPSVSAAELGRA